MTRVQCYKLIQKVLAGILLLGVPFMIASCTFETPTALSQKRLEVVPETYRTELASEDVNDAALEVIADDYYYKGGNMPLNIIVTYNPKSPGNTAMKASEQAAKVAAKLKRKYVSNVTTEVLPIHNSEESMTIVSFQGYRAQAPADCNNFADIDDSSAENYRTYKLGCSIEEHIASQVARPSELMGRSVFPDEDADGRRLGNVLEGYKSGKQALKPKDALKNTEQASEE